MNANTRDRGIAVGEKKKREATKENMARNTKIADEKWTHKGYGELQQKRRTEG